MGAFAPIRRPKAKPDGTMTLTEADRDMIWKAPWKAYEDPTDLIDDTRLDYEFRLDLLQHWLARIAEGEAEGPGRADVEAAILALEARSKLKTDEPEGTPEVHNYGVVNRSDLRRYSVSALAQRVWRFLRKR